jgi:hypothetical protein
VSLTDYPPRWIGMNRTDVGPAALPIAATCVIVSFAAISTPVIGGMVKSPVIVAVGAPTPMDTDTLTVVDVFTTQMASQPVIVIAPDTLDAVAPTLMPVPGTNPRARIVNHPRVCAGRGGVA